MQMIIIFMESAVSNHMLNASASPHHEPDAAFEPDFAGCEDAERLAIWAFRRWVLGLRCRHRLQVHPDHRGVG